MFKEEDKIDYKNKFGKEFPVQLATDAQIEKLITVLQHIGNKPDSTDLVDLWQAGWAALGNSDLKVFCIDFSTPLSEIFKLHNISPAGEVYLYIMEEVFTPIKDYDPLKKRPSPQYILSTDSEGLMTSLDYVWDTSNEYALICDQTGQWCVGLHGDLMAMYWKSS